MRNGLSINYQNSQDRLTTSFSPTTTPVLSRWAASIDSWVLYERLIEDIQHTQSKEQLVLNLGALLCYHRLSPPNPNANQPIKGSNLADFDAILKNVEYLGNGETVLVHMVLSVLRIFWTVKDDEKMRQWLATVLNLQPPSLDPFHKSSDRYWTCRVEQGLAHGDALDMAELNFREGRVGPARSGKERMVEEIATLDDEKKQDSGVTTTDDGWVLVGAQRKGSGAPPCVSDHKHPVLAFPLGVFHLEAYKLVHMYRSEVPPNERILSTIRLSDGPLVLTVLRSYISTLESNLRTCCFPYNVEPSKENVGLLGFVKAQNQQIDTLASMAIDAISRDTTLEKGLWICADPPHVLNHFTTWLRGAVLQSKGDFLAYPELTGIESDPESGRIQLDGYSFNSYTLVRVSNVGHHAQSLDEFVKFDAILSMDELEDESWELAVSKRFLPTLKDMLHEMVPDCIIESDYDPTEPNAKEVEELGSERARILKTHIFHVRAERCMREFWPKAAAFYRDLVTGGEEEMVVLEIDEEMDIHGNEEQEEEIMVEECMDDGWEIIQTLRLQS
ncbi:hypothetical protein DL98DRAFT_597224 [Cadophora sp. DSE1049]|nr:hypothetical protein DL98DRAFT_597224 [Cadophora sp. DSE1049]